MSAQPGNIQKSSNQGFSCGSILFKIGNGIRYSICSVVDVAGSSLLASASVFGALKCFSSKDNPVNHIGVVFHNTAEDVASTTKRFTTYAEMDPNMVAMSVFSIGAILKMSAWYFSPGRGSYPVIQVERYTAALNKQTIAIRNNTQALEANKAILDSIGKKS